MNFVTDIVTTTEPQAVDSLLPKPDAIVFDSDTKISHGIEPSIEDLVAILEMDYKEDGKMNVNRY